MEGDGAGGGCESGREETGSDTRESPSSPWALFTTTALCQGFSWGTLVLIKTGPILNSNPLAWLASSGNALSNHWNRWMFLHYRGWTVSINRVQFFLEPGWGWNSQHTFFRWIMQLFVMRAAANSSLKSSCQGRFGHMCPYSCESIWRPESIIPCSSMTLRFCALLFFYF